MVKIDMSLLNIYSPNLSYCLDPYQVETHGCPYSKCLEGCIVYLGFSFSFREGFWECFQSWFGAGRFFGELGLLVEPSVCVATIFANSTNDNQHPLQFKEFHPIHT